MDQHTLLNCGVERARLIISFRFAFRFGHSGFYNNPTVLKLFLEKGRSITKILVMTNQIAVFLNFT